MNAEEWDALIAAAPAHAPPYREDFRFVPTHEPRYLTPLSDMPTDPPPPLLLGRLHPIQATILYGPGDAGKGTLAVSWAKQLADTGRRVAILDYEGNDLEWSSRLHGLGGADVLYLAPSRDYPAGRVPHPPAAGGRRYPDMDSMRAAGLAGHVDQLKDELDDAEIDYIIIDSAGMAAPGDPGSPEPVMAYFAALQQLRRPSLTIAHTNRAGDSRYPFGSVYWHALSRLSWSLIPEGDDITADTATTRTDKVPLTTALPLDDFGYADYSLLLSYYPATDPVLGKGDGSRIQAQHRPTGLFVNWTYPDPFVVVLRDMLSRPEWRKRYHGYLNGLRQLWAEGFDGPETVLPVIVDGDA